jgi:hypothetical protein
MLKKYKLLQPLWRTVQKFLKKLKINITWHTVIPLLGIYLKGIKSAYKGDTSIKVSIDERIIKTIVNYFSNHKGKLCSFICSGIDGA